MEIVSTECTQEQQDEDRSELVELHTQALENEPTWQFFGGTITLENGNTYQVI